MLRSKKIEVVGELGEVCSELSTIVVIRYNGLTVAKATELRKSLKQHDATFRVVKNRLFKIAAANSNIADEIAGFFKGPTAIVFANEPVGISKVLCNFAKDNESLKIVGCILDKNVLDASTVEKLSKIPSLNELRAQIVGIINAPATKVVRILKEPASQIARVLGAYSSK